MWQKAEWGGKILLTVVEGESDLLLSGDGVEEGQTSEQEGVSSEKDIPAFEKPAQGQKRDTRNPLYCVS